MEESRSRTGKKTAEAIHQEVAREVDQLLRVIFTGRRKTGRLDLEAVEMAVRSAMHHAGAAALTELLQFPAPATDQRTVPCACGHAARYRGLRSKPVLTAVGSVDSLAPLLSVRALPHRPVPRRCRNWTLRTRSSLPACVACRPWWDRRFPSIKAANT